MNEISIKELNPTDRVFKCDRHFVKVRLEKKEIVQKDKLFGPAAISLKFTASVCNRDGKAIPRTDGRFCILPQTVTVPVVDYESQKSLEQELEQVLAPLVQKAVRWHKAVMAAEQFVKNWEVSQLPQSPRTKKTS